MTLLHKVHVTHKIRVPQPLYVVRSTLTVQRRDSLFALNEQRRTYNVQRLRPSQ